MDQGKERRCVEEEPEPVAQMGRVTEVTGSRICMNTSANEEQAKKIKIGAQKASFLSIFSHPLNYDLLRRQ